MKEITYEEFLSYIVTGDAINESLVVVLYIGLSLTVLFGIYCFIGSFVRFVFEFIRIKLTAKRLGIRREDDQSFMGSLPLRDCPCCGTPPLAKLVNKRVKIGYIYCPGCQLHTEQSVMYKAAMNWNRRPNQVDCIGLGDYKQIFEMDQKCSKY